MKAVDNSTSLLQHIAMVDCNAEDILGTIGDVGQVWRWYNRLAQSLSARPVSGGGTPLSSQFLTHYLHPHAHKDPVVFNAPDYVKNLPQIDKVLRYHRNVYLSAEAARIGSARKITGIRPRWQNPAQYGWTKGTPIVMHYESLVELPLRWQVTGNNDEKDMITSLGLGFQLRTDVRVVVSPTGDARSVKAVFQSFMASIRDRYDFDYSEHFTVPNPDYPDGPVCPSCDRIKVYHTNARRMENARLAVPYSLESLAWPVVTHSVIMPGRVRV